MIRGENYKVYYVLYTVAIAFIVLFRCPSLLAASYQKVYLSPSDVNKSIGSELVVSVMYDVSDDNNKLAGVGVRFHYDSSKLEYLGHSNEFAFGLMSSPLEKLEDPMKTDSDPETDRMIVTGWASIQQSSWPGQDLPVKLIDYTFKVKSGIDSSDTSLNLGFTSVANGYYGLPENGTVHITNLPTVSWTKETFMVMEDSASFEITAQLSYTSAQDILVPFTVTGTAESGADYETIETSITIPSGETSASKMITIITDKIIESDETLIFTINSISSGAVLGMETVQTVTIQNDDEGYFTTPITPTPNSLQFYGDNFKINGELADIGDEIGVFDPDDILCGRVIIANQGLYVVTVYGDDSTSEGVDEGAEIGDVLTFKVWDSSSDSVLTVSGSMFVPEDLFNGAIQASPHSPPQWTANNDRWGLNIQITSSQEIPLREGWNLFSFSVNKVFYDSANQPTIDVLSNAEYSKVGSLNDALSSIDGKYILIRNFDANGAQTFDPLVPSFFNTLHYLAAGYGYWIKMKEDSTLILSGPRANPSEKLPLRTGWNLIGCWHTDAQYDSEAPPTIGLPSQVISTKVTNLNDVVSSISNSYSIIRNYDINGAGTYDPLVPAFFNTLHYISPGYGYWIKLKEPKELNY